MTAIPIIALDVQDIGRALAIVRDLGDSCGFYKIGSELFTAAGPAAAAAVRAEGKRVFLDLKFHDIPNTVRAGCAAARQAGASLVTVHAWGGERMMAAAVEGAGDDCGVLAVTILTSLDGDELARATGRLDVSVPEEVSRLAGIARRAGVHGVVCSGHEASRLRAEHGPGLALLVPGIRLAAGAAHDQSRIMTPRAAAEAGATYLVLGRAVTEAAEPRRAMLEVLSSLAGTP
ncbi:MAG TPA: orotidine-5'-phosphate decarboxylase [Gemmatimonadaceae bacterium]